MSEVTVHPGNVTVPRPRPLHLPFQPCCPGPLGTYLEEPVHQDICYEEGTETTLTMGPRRGVVPVLQPLGGGAEGGGRYERLWVGTRYPGG